MLAVVLLDLLVLGPLTHPALFTTRQWHIKLTGSDTQKQHHSQIRVLVWLLQFCSSIPHWCISKTVSTKRYVNFLLCKWKNCNTWSCVSACCLIQASCSEELPIVELPSWTKKDPTDLSEWSERFKSHRWGCAGTCQKTGTCQKQIIRDRSMIWKISPGFFFQLAPTSQAYVHHVQSIWGYLRCLYAPWYWSEVL